METLFVLKKVYATQSSRWNMFSLNTLTDDILIQAIRTVQPQVAISLKWMF